MFVCVAITVPSNAQRQTEKLDRGLVAFESGSGVRLSWRIPAGEYLDAGYNIYRDSVRIDSVTADGTSNYFDPAGSAGMKYQVAAVIDGTEQEWSKPAGVWGSNFLDIPLDRPEGGTTPDGVDYTYSPNDASVGDLDGDGRYEIVLKWDPSNSHDNSQSGYTGDVFLDAYELNGTRLWRIDLGINIRAGAHYTQFQVFDYDGDGKAEVACKTADGTTDGEGTVNGDPSADYRNSSGYVLNGPEFLTVFNGETGAAMQTVNYIPARGSVSSWGDGYGNRVDRFLACTAYLDGVHPSLVMCRGYYTRTVLAAWDWRNDTLTSRWVFDTNNGHPDYTGQGNHNILVADVDADGKDEIIYGAMAIDDNGSGLWTTGLGHGDAQHVSDIDPDRPGLEKWGITESAATSGSQLIDARTGEIIWGTVPGDIARGVAGDITAEYPGMECWGGTGGLRTARGEYAGPYPSSSNFVIQWDGDDLSELLDNTTISKFDQGVIFSAVNCASNNGTKATPTLSADILGDYREEVIFRKTDSKGLRLYITPYSTTRRLYTLMHDPQYRLAIAWQNTGYNQPPHTSFFFGDGMADPPPPPVIQTDLRWDEGDAWDLTSTNWIRSDTSSVYQDGDGVLFDLYSSGSQPISLNGTLTPSRVYVYSPNDYDFTGSGKLSGTMGLLKAGAGALSLNTDNDYSGATDVWQGSLLLNGVLSQSTVTVRNQAVAGGSGSYGGGLILEKGGSLLIGENGQADTLRVDGRLMAAGASKLSCDLSPDTSGTGGSNDVLLVNGDLVVDGALGIGISLLGDSLQAGQYTLVRYTGTFSGDAGYLEVTGLEGIPNSLIVTDSTVVLDVIDLRDPSTIKWTGNYSGDWDLATSMNWDREGQEEWFVPEDTVLFDDEGDPNTDINLVGMLKAGAVIVDAPVDYTINGNGSIIGPGSLKKEGSGTLTMNTQNAYTGPTLVSDGILAVPGLADGGKESPVGASSSDPDNLTLDDGTLRITGPASATDRGILLDDGGGTISLPSSSNMLTVSGEITGNGKLTKEGNGRLVLAAENTYSGGSLISGGRIDLGSEEANLDGFGQGTVRLENTTLTMFLDRNSYSENCDWNLEVPGGSSSILNMDPRCTLTGSLTGAGTLEVNIPYVRSEFGGDWSQFSGSIDVVTDSDEGWMLLGNANGFGTASLDLGSNVLMIYRNTEDAVVEIGSLSGSPGAELGAGGQATSLVTWVIGDNGKNAVYDGLISDRQYRYSGASAKIVKTGNGTWTLTHGNTYSGGTEVRGGILNLEAASGSAAGSGMVRVMSGASMRGTGMMDGSLVVEGQASMTVGTSNQLEEFTVGGDASFDEGSFLSVGLDPVDKKAEKLIVGGKLSLGGILYANKIKEGEFRASETYRILEADTIVGNFTQVVPSVPGEGLVWDLQWINPYGIIQIAREGSIGVEDKDAPLDMVVYPNPGSGNVRVLVSPSNGITPSDGVAVLRCFDPQGRLIIEKNMNTATGGMACEVDVAGWPPGTYIFSADTDEGSTIRRFVKQ